MRKTLQLLLLFMVVVSITIPAIAEDNTTIIDALKNNITTLSFRLRHEHVEVDNTANDDANALTLRTRLNYTTGIYKGLSALIEMDDVTELGDSDYPTSKALKNTGNYPGKAIIADPKSTEVNQSYLSYIYDKTTAKYGRQRILLDNQRFVGGVGFRQNEQTFDALSISNSNLANTKIFYAHINNVNRIFSEHDLAVSDTDSSTNLLNINYSGWQVGNVVFYTYLIDEQRTDTQYNSYGLRFSGKAGNFAYTLEYANQEKELVNGQDFDANYLHAEGSLTLVDAMLTLGFENLGSDDGSYGFSTPLATGHKFQGWTDSFLSTPNEGVADIYFSAGIKIKGVKFFAVYHDFTAVEQSTNGDDDLGSEYGLLIAKKFSSYGLSIKYASYSAGDDFFNKSDTEKLWLTASANF